MISLGSSNSLKSYKVSMLSDLSWFQGTGLSDSFWQMFMATNGNNIFNIAYILNKKPCWVDVLFKQIMIQNVT